MESHISQNEIAAKSAKQQLQMLEQMRKQHQLQSHLTQMNEGGGTDKKIKYNRASVSAAIYNGDNNSDDTASVVAAIRKQKHKQSSKPTSSVQNLNGGMKPSMSMEEEADRLRSLVENLSLASSKSDILENKKSDNSDLYLEAKAYELAVNGEINKKIDEYSEEQLWEKTNVSSILKADVGQHDNDSNESRDDQTNSSGSGDDIGSESAEDYSDDEDEGEDDYKPGGYHRVTIGETYNQR